MGNQNQTIQPFNLQTAWTGEIPDEQWEFYQKVIAKAREYGLRFALGGGFAVATYTGRWSNTKDLDFYVLPPDRDAMVDALGEVGFQDYYEVLPYQRHWIYRGYQGDKIVDVIWAMANGRNVTDNTWLTGGPEIDLCEEKLHIVPAEEMIWAKLYVMQKERCDWPDVFNMLYKVGPELNWERLLERLEKDAPLIGGGLNVFGWLDPERAMALPRWLWKSLHLRKPEKNASVEATYIELVRQRASLLDTRPWYLRLIESDNNA